MDGDLTSAGSHARAISIEAANGKNRCFEELLERTVQLDSWFWGQSERYERSYLLPTRDRDVLGPRGSSTQLVLAR